MDRYYADSPIWTGTNLDWKSLTCQIVFDSGSEELGHLHSHPTGKFLIDVFWSKIFLCAKDSRTPPSKLTPLSYTVHPPHYELLQNSDNRSSKMSNSRQWSDTYGRLQYWRSLEKAGSILNQSRWSNSSREPTHGRKTAAAKVCCFSI